MLSDFISTPTYFQVNCKHIATNVIENRETITIDDCGTKYEGVFLDFDSDNGYAVVGNDYELLDIATEGYSPFHNLKCDSLFYSVTTGYYYLLGYEYLSVNADNNSDDNFFYNNLNTQHYDGQEKDKTGCGKIEDTDKYVNSRYGSGWSKGKSCSLHMQGYSQSNLSCYRHNKIDGNTISPYSEGNCWVVSAYTVLQYLADTKWTNMPSNLTYTNYYPISSEPNIYSLYYDQNGNNISKTINNNGLCAYEYELKNNSLWCPELYTDVRKHINDKYKKCNSGTIYETSEIIEYVANQYGYHVDAKEHVFWPMYVNEGIKKLDSGSPLLWSTSNCTYNSHTMAVCGYKYYSKTTGWWIFKTTQYKVFYEIRDGHTELPRFFDMTGHVGFGAIISLEF